MTRHARAFALALVALGVVGHTTTARAAGGAAAQALFEEARKAMAAGDYAAACPKLEASQKLDPAAGTIFNLAICYEKSGRTASAWVTYLDAATAYKTSHRAEWETKARERAAALAPTLSKLTIVAPYPAPAELRVTRDGAVVQPAELGAAIPVDPGHHVIEATAKGYERFRTEIDAAAGAHKTVTVALARGDAESPATESASAVPPSSSGTQRTLGFVVGGVGVAALAASGVTGLVAIGKNSDSTRECPDDGPCPSAAAVHANAQAKDFATISTITFVAGAALLATGVVLVLTDSRRSSSAYVTPMIGFGHAGLAGAF